MDWLAHENASSSPNDKKISNTHTSLNRLGAIMVLTLIMKCNGNNFVCSKLLNKFSHCERGGGLTQ